MIQLDLSIQSNDEKESKNSSREALKEELATINTEIEERQKVMEDLRQFSQRKKQGNLSRSVLSGHSTNKRK